MVENEGEIKIGFEVHVPLKTKQKLFCSCPTNYWEVEEPNVNICPVCTGQPGAKPYPLNKDALDAAIVIARLLECEIVSKKIFIKRKHYDYPDLPSGYQRTSEPIGINGNLEGVGIWEVHLEEDPGRYDLTNGVVDYNRSGVPLIEIVTAPDIHSPEEARRFLRELTNMLAYTERVVDVGGVMRADVNLSIGNTPRVEIKNINSVKGVFKALNFELLRRKNILKRGGELTQETRGFNEKTMVTMSLRSKETVADYRYLPDPDIPPLELTTSYINSLPLPETPQSRRKRLREQYGIEERYARVLVMDKYLADLFEEVVKKFKINPKLAALWITKEVLRQLNYRSIGLRESKLTPVIIAELCGMVERGEITENVGKKLLERVVDTGESPLSIVKNEGLGKVSESEKLELVVKEVIKENPQAVADYKHGKKEALNFLMGKVMAKMRGRADVSVVLPLLRKNLT